MQTKSTCQRHNEKTSLDKNTITLNKTSTTIRVSF
jgi:hypothetical protein